MREGDPGPDDLTVNEAAEALGTTPQTVRALLRRGELRGRQRAWGSRYVWVPSREGVDEFLTAYGRLEGRRRRPVSELRLDVAADTGPQAEQATDEAVQRLATVEVPRVVVPPPVADDVLDHGRAPQRPWVLRVRGRATVVVVLLGVPMAVAYGGLRVLPDALWFDEVGQAAVFRGILMARLQLYVLVGGVAACFIGANLALAVGPAATLQRRARTLAITGVSIITGSLFATSVQSHWQTYLLWRHRQSFGVTDPVHGRDVGFFVFTLPLALMVAAVLLWLVAVAGCYVAVAYKMQGRLHVSRPGMAFAPLLHLAVLSALFLLVAAWRFQLEQFRLELGPPSSPDSGAVAGAGYVDVHVRFPGLTALTIAAVALAVACLVAPFVVRSGRAWGSRRVVVVTGLAMAVTVALIGAGGPALVQRFVVDPSPVLREEPYLASSIAATRHGLGLDSVVVEPYTPTGSFSAADFPALSKRLADVPVWDRWVLAARMRQLVNETPYYSPQDPVLDVTTVDGRRQLTIVGARELDVRLIRGNAATWINNRLAYTHGLGLIRFSATHVEPGREPRLLDSSTDVAEPRIYFGQSPRSEAEPAADDEDEDDAGVDEGGEGDETPRSSEPVTRTLAVASPWVVTNTRRPEVDIPASAAQQVYHYAGTGGIRLSSMFRRVAFALALGSKELLLSDDITPESRVLVHRDVRDRLTALAPFIQWDTNAVPLTADGRIIFAVDGYTTSRNYPYAQLVDLGGVPVNYARASVRATVDAFSGEVVIYVVDPSEPIAHAWAEAFPTIFHAEHEMPTELWERWRYPADLFAAQATAYERFHTTRPDLFVSEADAWSRPIALSGPVEVAGDVNFDESDEDDLRLIMEPDYSLSRPPGGAGRRLVLSTYYTPRRAQNLVATLSGWIDDNGQARLTARNLPRDEVTLGPAQMSRLVFATPRVTNLLGLRNLELRDVDTSSLDAVLLGRPRLLFLPQGVAQVQSLYEGSRGPGAARLLGVTAYLDGQAGLGPDIESALRQALNEPPRIEVLTPGDPAAVGGQVELVFDVENARKATVTITSPAGRHSETLDIASGSATTTWVPTVAGEAVVRMRVVGLDGTRVADSIVLEVLDRPPTVRLDARPIHATVGELVRVPFRLQHALSGTATISTRSGIVFSREYLLRQGTGVVKWTPEQVGTAVLRVRALGHQGQIATKRLSIIVLPRPDPPDPPPPPTVVPLAVPEVATVGEPVEFTFRAFDCSAAVARIEGPGETVLSWRFPCPAREATFAWTPTVPGRYVLTLLARSADTTAKVTTVVTVELVEPST